MGADGWLGIGWPTEYGGQGRPRDRPVHLLRRGAAGRARRSRSSPSTPSARRSCATAPTSRRRASCPGSCAGEIELRDRLHRARGRHRPRVAAHPRRPRRRRVRRSTATRSSPAAPTRPTTSGSPAAPTPTRRSTRASRSSSCRRRRPGFTCTPIVTVGGIVTTATYYDDVRVPVANLVGDENGGWRLITTQLNHERVGLAALGGRADRLCDDVGGAGPRDERRRSTCRGCSTDLARSPRPARGDEAAQLAHGGGGRRRRARARPTRRRSRSSAPRPSSRCTACCSASSAPVGYAARRARRARSLRGEVERGGRAAQINTFGGGVNEVQREIVAAAGLGMARGSRREVSDDDGARRRVHARSRRSRAQRAGAAEPAPDPVNQAMIRHWVEAMGDTNPVYVDAEAAAATGRTADRRPAGDAPGVGRCAASRPGGATGPAAGPRRAARPARRAPGFTSVVATNCEQEYDRELRLGDHLITTTTSSSRCPRRSRPGSASATSSPRGSTYRDQDGELVGSDALPHPASSAPATGRSAPRAQPKPAPAAPGDQPRQRVLVRGRQRAPAAHPALRGVRRAAPPARADVPAVPVARVGHRRGGRAGAPSTASSSTTTRRSRRSTTRSPSALDRARGGHAPRRQHRRRRARRRRRSAWRSSVEWLDADDELTLPVFQPAPGG